MCKLLGQASTVTCLVCACTTPCIHLVVLEGMTGITGTKVASAPFGHSALGSPDLVCALLLHTLQPLLIVPGQVATLQRLCRSCSHTWHWSHSQEESS